MCPVRTASCLIDFYFRSSRGTRLHGVSNQQRRNRVQLLLVPCDTVRNAQQCWSKKNDVLRFLCSRLRKPRYRFQRLPLQKQLSIQKLLLSVEYPKFVCAYVERRFRLVSEMRGKCGFTHTSVTIR